MADFWYAEPTWVHYFNDRGWRHHYPTGINESFRLRREGEVRSVTRIDDGEAVKWHPIIRAQPDINYPYFGPGFDDPITAYVHAEIAGWRSE